MEKRFWKCPKNEFSTRERPQNRFSTGEKVLECMFDAMRISQQVADAIGKCQLSWDDVIDFKKNMIDNVRQKYNAPHRIQERIFYRQIMGKHINLHNGKLILKYREKLKHF